MNQLLHFFLSGFFLLTAGTLVAQLENDVPPNAEPGKCYAQCLIPDQYKTVTEEVMVKEPASKLIVSAVAYAGVEEPYMVQEASKKLIPAAPVYTTVYDTLIIKEASIRLEYVPAVYKTVTEQVLIKEGFTQKIPVPAEYEEITEQVLVSEATMRWERGKKDPNCLSEDPEDCRVLCLVEVPAVYKTVNKRVLKNPARIQEEAVPPVYKTVSREVIETPARVREVPIPAETRVIARQVVSQPAIVKEETIAARYTQLAREIVSAAPLVDEEVIPAEYITVEKTVLVKKGGYTEWREVLCASDITAARILAIQKALQQKGYDPGPLDNQMGAQTRAALTRFQRDYNLPVGALDMDTLRVLGVE